MNFSLTSLKSSEESSGEKNGKRNDKCKETCRELRKAPLCISRRGIGAVEGAPFGSCYTILVPSLILPVHPPMSVLPVETAELANSTPPSFFPSYGKGSRREEVSVVEQGVSYSF